MDNEREKEWDPQHLPAFQTEYAYRMERALMRVFPSSITSRVGVIYDKAGGLSVNIPSGLSDDRQQRLIEISQEIYLQLHNEFGSYLSSYEQKNAPITGIALNSSSPDIPPLFGERLLLLILRTREERANIPGDLEEEFKQIATKHGARYAKVWYYKQVAVSAWPLIRKAVKWGMWAWVGEWIRRII